MDEDVRATIIKVVAMLVLVAAEWWAMQPYHEPLLAAVYQKLAKLCYTLARILGGLGLKFEVYYYEAVRL